MWFVNAKIYTKDFLFKPGKFCVEDGRFSAVLTDDLSGAGDFTGEADDRSCVDLAGAYVIPGLVDIHCHGNSGVDYTRCGSYENIVTTTSYLAKSGITSLLFTSTSEFEPTLEESFRHARSYMENTPSGCSWLHGIHMEGPFFCEAKKGAHHSKYLRAPDFDMFSRLDEASGCSTKIVCLAAELDNSLSFIKKAKDITRVSIAHSNAGYNVAKAAFDAGASHVTHLFNAMPPFLHREPGIIGAAADSPHVMVEVISDGLHVHESAVRAAFKIFSPERIILISDNIAPCGLPEGIYGEGDERVAVKGRLIRLLDGTIAGSGTTLYDGMKMAVSFGVRTEDAVRCATYNPAKAIGVLDTAGTIEEGKSADFVICKEGLDLKSVYIKGCKAV